MEFFLLNLSPKLLVLDVDRIPWNFEFPNFGDYYIQFCLMDSFAQVNRHPVSFYVSFTNLFFLSIFALYHFTVLLITHYVSPFKISFQCSLKLISIKTFHGISTEFHGTFWTTFEQHIWFHGIPWNLNNKTSSSVEFHGILSRSKVSWCFIELFPCSRVQRNSVVVHGTSYFPDKSSIEFHGTW